ncbi:MAG: formylglycine-generating enzyme family protein [Leptolyngbyaceae cyanobacterium MO_188.B28]|nr:formylglycine-generating enzyme family protein [Leptolyngbyaceae cyanobacterium MO_188.B28]
MKLALPTLIFEFDTVHFDSFGVKCKYERRQAHYFHEPLSDGVPLEMIEIPEGIVQIGSPNTEAGRSNDEKEPHSVALNSFFISKYPITQVQWRAIASLPKVKYPLHLKPSAFEGLNRPVEKISWIEASEFCARLSAITGRTYRLPTEIEWEYACRAGTSTPFHFGETLTTDLANYCGEDHHKKNRRRQGIWYKGNYGNGPTGIARRETTEVGYFKVANTFGLYDLHGNVWEWCSHDCWKQSTNEEEQIQQPLRGGSWKSSPSACRSASRLLLSPNCQEAFVGFRVVYSIEIGPSSFQEPSQNLRSQSILSNVQAGRDITIGNITQIFNK